MDLRDSSPRSNWHTARNMYRTWSLAQTGASSMHRSAGRCSMASGPRRPGRTDHGPQDCACSVTVRAPLPSIGLTPEAESAPESSPFGIHFPIETPTLLDYGAWTHGRVRHGQSGRGKGQLELGRQSVGSCHALPVGLQVDSSEWKRLVENRETMFHFVIERPTGGRQESS